MTDSILELPAAVLAYGPPSQAVRIACLVVLGMLCMAGLLSVLRILRGPTLADRVVAIDLLGTLVVGGVAIFTIISGEPIFLLVSMLLALLLFIGTVAFAGYLQSGADR